VFFAPKSASLSAATILELNLFDREGKSIRSCLCV